jgi:fatty-acyl-CoA synthase
MSQEKPLSYYKTEGDVSLLSKTIPGHFHDVVTLFPDRPAVVSRHLKTTLSYAELAERVDHLARGLVALGFTKGDRIGIWSTNNLEWLILQLATARIGVILVTINPAYRLKELAHALTRSELQAIFSIPSFRSSDYVDMLSTLLPELES